MIIYPNPRRTRILLRIRRIISGRLAINRSDWSQETRDERTNRDMKGINTLPMRKLRLLLGALEEGSSY